MASASGNEPGAIVPANVGAAADVVARHASALAVSDADTGATAPPRTRRALVLVAAGAAAFAVAYALAPHADQDAGVELRSPATGRATVAATDKTRAKNAAVALTAPNRAEVVVQPAADPFVAVSFLPPPPPPPPVVAAPPPPPPPAPKAPPLPFAFVGLLEKGGGPKPAAFLARGDVLLVVSAGDIVDNEYRIESLSEREIVVTYLPLNERQSLTATGGRQ